MDETSIYDPSHFSDYESQFLLLLAEGIKREATVEHCDKNQKTVCDFEPCLPFLNSVAAVTS